MIVAASLTVDAAAAAAVDYFYRRCCYYYCCDISWRIVISCLENSKYMKAKQRIMLSKVSNADEYNRMISLLI